MQLSSQENQVLLGKRPRSEDVKYVFTDRNDDKLVKLPNISPIANDPEWTPNIRTAYRMKSRLQDQTSVVLSAKTVTSRIADAEGIISRKAVSIIGGLFTGIGISGDLVTLSPKSIPEAQRD